MTLFPSTRDLLIEHLKSAEPTPQALAIAAEVPSAVWPWEIRELALVLDFAAPLLVKP